MPPPVLRRLSPQDDLAPVHSLLTHAFAFMDGVIDPPSSLHRMTSDDMARTADQAELWVLDPGPVACMVLTPQADTLYLGKLAVAEAQRGRGLSRRLIEHAVARARALGLPSLTLQTRVELTTNQTTFRHLGFVEIARTAHPGYDRPTSITYRRAL